MPDNIETRLARVEARGEARDQAIKDWRIANDRAVAELNARLEKLDASLDALADRLGASVISVLERSQEQFVSRETLTWWTSLLTKGLLWLVALGLFTIATGRWPNR